MFSVCRFLVLLPLFWAVTVSAQDTGASDTKQTAESEAVDYSRNFTLEEGQELPRSAVSKGYHSEIKKILSGDDFAKKRTVERWRFIDLDDEQKKSEREKVPEWIINIVEYFERNDSNVVALSRGLEFFLWAILVGLIVFFVVRYREQLGGFFNNFGAQTPVPDLPSSMFGLDIKQDSIPEDVIQAARSAWSSDQPRDAVAILLRSSLILLLHEHNCRFFDSDTEAECCDRIDQQAPQAVSVYMRKLVTAWQSIAYAHVAPSDAVFDQLCQQWSEVF